MRAYWIQPIELHIAPAQVFLVPHWMKIVILLFVAVFVSNACTSQPVMVDEILMQDLAQNEALIVAVDACHWGCTRGLVRFEAEEASTTGLETRLTYSDRQAIDAHLKTGLTLAEMKESKTDAHRCSTIVKMRTAKMRNNRMVEVTPLKIYACHNPNQTGRTAFDIAEELLSVGEENLWESTRLVPDEETLDQLSNSGED